ncbi:unnamed protein product [Citrullus colocynthis]|uniref:Uncharacterized protein n=1 Tax=Citrullus colocynthis TaxID=252529 RepID=A0ABP0YXF2_9ROSI
MSDYLANARFAKVIGHNFKDCKTYYKKDLKGENPHQYDHVLEGQMEKADGLNPKFGLNSQHPGTRKCNSSPRVLSQKSAHSKGKNPKALALKKRARETSLPSLQPG